jgi:hypothetical protein
MRTINKTDINLLEACNIEENKVNSVQKGE